MSEHENIPLREGSVRLFDEATQEWRVAEPGSMWFSTITIGAQEVYLNGQWEPIFPDQKDDNDAS